MAFRKYFCDFSFSDLRLFVFRRLLNEVISACAEISTAVKVIENDVNMGAGMSRRRGIESATSEYVLLLDGDDYLNKNYIKALLDRAEETDADVVSSGIKIINQDGSWKGESYGNTTTFGNDKITRFWGERVVFMNNKIIRRKLYDYVQYCHRRYIEDTPTIIPILWYANKVEYVDMLGYNYVMRESSLTHNTNLLKDVIYKGLCWLDLLDFFEDKDTSIFKEVDIPAYLKNIISCLNSMNGLTTKDIEPYLVDWQEFTLRLINRISVHEVSFK